MYFAICVVSYLHHMVIAFQTLDILYRSEDCRRLINNIFKNTAQFLWTIILLFILLFTYSFFTFYFFNGEFINPDAETPITVCTDTFQCFLMVADYGMRAGGGLGDALSIPFYDRESNVTDMISRVFFDLFFFIFIITIALHIMFGMVVDSFKDLSSEKYENEEDQENHCFICSLERSEYEKYADFDEHTEKEHCIWNYMFYILFLEHKAEHNSNELTKVEDSILKKYIKKSVRWFPAGRSQTFERLLEAKNGKKEKNDAEELSDMIEEIEEKMKGLHFISKFVEEIAEKKEEKEEENKKKEGEKPKNILLKDIGILTKSQKISL